MFTAVSSCGGTVLLAVVDLSPVPRHLPYVEQQSASLSFLTAACNFRLQRIGTVPREIGSRAARRAEGTSSATSFVGGGGGGSLVVNVWRLFKGSGFPFFNQMKGEIFGFFIEQQCKMCFLADMSNFQL